MRTKSKLTAWPGALICVTVAACISNDGTYSLAVDEPSFDDPRRELLDVRVKVVSCDAQDVCTESSEEMDAGDLAERVAIECAQRMKTDGDLAPFTSCDGTEADTFLSSQGNCHVGMCRMHVALCTANRLMELSGTVAEVDVTTTVSTVTDTVTVAPQSLETNTALAEKAFVYARRALTLASLNLQRSSDRTTTGGLCKNSDLIDTGNKIAGGPGYAESLAAVFGEAFLLVRESAERAADFNARAADSTITGWASRGEGSALGWNGEILSRARSQHLMLGGEWSSGTSAYISGGTRTGFCPISPPITDAERTVLDLIRESAPHPSNVYDLTGTTLPELIETGSGAVSDTPMGQRLSELWSQPELGTMSADDFMDHFGVSEGDFTRVRQYLAEEQRALGRSTATKMTPRILVDDADGNPRTETADRWSATGNRPVEPPDAFFVARAREGTEGEHHGQTPWVGTASAVPTLEYALGPSHQEGLAEQGGLAPLLDFAASIAFDSAGLTALNSTTREGVAALLPSITRERRGRLEVCRRDDPTNGDEMRIRMFGFDDPTEFVVVRGTEGLECGVQGGIDGAPCDLADHDVTIASTNTGTTSDGQVGFRRYAELMITAGLSTPDRFYVLHRKESAGPLALPDAAGSYEALGSAPVVDVASDDDWAYCNLLPIIDDTNHRAADFGMPRAGRCGEAANSCSKAPGRIPLEDELTDDGDAYESSWRHYLDLALDAANRADQLGEDLIQEGMEQESRREDALETLEATCGGPLNLEPYLPDSPTGSIHPTVTCTGADEGGPCDSPATTHTCVNGQCIYDPMRAFEEASSSDATAARLAECLGDAEILEFVALGSRNLCLWRNQATQHEICDPAGAATPGTECPYLLEMGECAAGLEMGFEPVEVTHTLDVFSASPEGSTEETVPPCSLVRAARNPDLPAATRAGAVDRIVASRFFNFENLQRWAKRIGWEARVADHGALTVDGLPWRWTGQYLDASEAGSSPWPCSGAMVSDCATPPIGLEEELLETGLFCTQTNCTATRLDTVAREDRARLNYRLFHAIRSLRWMTGQDMLGVGWPARFPVDESGVLSAFTYPADVRVLDEGSPTAPLNVLTGSSFTWPEAEDDDCCWSTRRESEVVNADGYCIDEASPGDQWIHTTFPDQDPTRTAEHVRSTCDRDDPYSIWAVDDAIADTRSSVSQALAARLWERMDGRRGSLSLDGLRGRIRTALYEQWASDRVFLGPGVSGSQSLNDQLARRRVRVRDLFDSMELVCEVALQYEPDCSLETPPAIDSVADLRAAQQYMGCVAARLQRLGEREVLRNVPSGAVASARGVSSLDGHRGEHVRGVEAGLIGLRTYPRAIADEIRGFAWDMEELRMALARSDIRHERADLAVSSATVGAFASCASGLGTAVATEGATLIAAVATCAVGAAQVANAIEDSELLHRDIELEGDMTMGTFRERFHNRVSRLEGLGDSLLETTAELEGSLTGLEADRQTARRALGRALGLGYDTQERGFAVDTLSRRRFNTLQKRYEEAYAHAIEMAEIARVAVEQRLAVRLADLDRPMTLVDAPRTWANDACRSSGVDYARLRDSTRLLDGAGDNYADAYIGDYVRKLERVVESYRLDFPFQNADDTAVISLRDDVVRARGVCGASVPNLLAYSGQLDVSADPETEQPVWEAIDCDPLAPDGDILNCVSATRLPDSPSLLDIPELADVRGYRVTFARGVSSGTGTTSFTSTTELAQRLTLPPGRYLLSWYGREAEGVSFDPADAVRVVDEDDTDPPTVAEGTVNVWEQCDATRECEGHEECRLGERCISDQCCFVRAAGDWRLYYQLVTVSEETAVRVAILPDPPSPLAEHSIDIAGVQLENVADLPEASIQPREFFPTTSAGQMELLACPDTTGSAFRSRWTRGCENLCPTGFGPDCHDREEHCYRQLNVYVSMNDIESGRIFSRAGFAYGNYNYRIDSLGLNFVGSNVRNCEDVTRPETCYATAAVPFSIRHIGPYGVRNHWGHEYSAPLFTGNLEHGRGLAAERYITNPISSADRTMLEPFLHREFRGRPLTGAFEIRVWETEGVDIESIEDIQLVLNYRYWTRFE